MAILGTSDVVADMNTLASSATVTDMDLLATSANVTAMGHLGTSANVTAMGHLGTSANVTGKWYWVRSPEVILDGNSNKNLTIAYNATTRTGVATRMVDAADNQLFRWWWIPS